MATTFVADSSSRVRGYPPTSQRKIVSGVLTTTGGDGAGVGDIPASLFGLSKIEESSPLVISTNIAVVPTAPVYDGTSLLATEPGVGGLYDIPSGAYQITVKGY